MILIKERKVNVFRAIIFHHFINVSQFLIVVINWSDVVERSKTWRIIKTCCLSQATSKHNTAQIFLSFYQCCVCWSPVVLFKCEICCTHTMARNVTNVSQCESDQMGLIVPDDGLDSFGSQLHSFTHQTIGINMRKVHSHLLWPPLYCEPSTCVV